MLVPSAAATFSTAVVNQTGRRKGDVDTFVFRPASASERQKGSAPYGRSGDNDGSRPAR